MQILVPKYYFDFKCIAGKCKHNCCIGWEIDIDADTYDYYTSADTSLRNRLIDNTEVTDDVPHFKLGKDERCPFLNKNNLCDIICELSHDGLCQICKDHPRFRNFFDDHVEMGLGMTCEEAARIVLTAELQDAVTLVSLDGSEDDVPMFPERFTAFDVLLDCDMTLPEKIRATLAICSGELPCKTVSEWVDIYNDLELLDEAWKTKLELLKDETAVDCDIPLSDYCESILLHPDLSLLLTRLLTYFLYRHLADGIDDDSLGARASFSVLSVLIIAALFKVHLEVHGELSDDQIVNIVRMYSSEIEYSDENLDKLIDICR